LGEPNVKVPNELETPGFDIVSKKFVCQIVYQKRKKFIEIWGATPRIVDAFNLLV